MRSSSLWSLLLALLAGCGRIDFDPRPVDAGAEDASSVDWPTLDAQWTWMGGSQFKDGLPDYGTLGVPAPSSDPGARDNGGMWVANNELWLFGGLGFSPQGFFAGHGDLWSYGLATNLWTWRGGTQTLNPAGVFGTQGSPDPANQPPARNDPSFWSTEGSLWMYGGVDTTQVDKLRSDMWRYDLALGQWAWMDGATSSGAMAVHGTQGVANAANTPGARGSQGSWTDATGAWLYGGNSLDAGPVNEYADLWRFEYATGLWTWVSGRETFGEPTVRGTRGVPSTSNQPRRGEVCPLGDASAGELWMVDGSADIWRYTVATREWTWVAGPATNDALPIHGALDQTSSTSMPGRRTAIDCWRDLRGNVWLFGGEGRDAAGDFGRLGDTWVYEVDTDRWTWIAGSNERSSTPVFGSQGVADTANSPGARLGGAHWVAPDGSLWLFGGDFGIDVMGIEGSMNDLWRLSAPP